MYIQSEKHNENIISNPRRSYNLFDMTSTKSNDYQYQTRDTKWRLDPIPFTKMF